MQKVLVGAIRQPRPSKIKPQLQNSCLWPGSDHGQARVRYYMFLFFFLVLTGEFSCLKKRLWRNSATVESFFFVICPCCSLSPAPPRVVSCDHCSSQVLVPVLHVVLMVVGRVMRVGRQEQLLEVGRAHLEEGGNQVVQNGLEVG